MFMSSYRITTAGLGEHKMFYKVSTIFFLTFMSVSIYNSMKHGKCFLYILENATRERKKYHLF